MSVTKELFQQSRILNEDIINPIQLEGNRVISSIILATTSMSSLFMQLYEEAGVIVNVHVY